MTKTQKIWLAVGIVVVIGAAVGYYFWQKNQSGKKDETKKDETNKDENIIPHGTGIINTLTPAEVALQFQSLNINPRI